MSVIAHKFRLKMLNDDRRGARAGNNLFYYSGASDRVFSPLTVDFFEIVRRKPAGALQVNLPFGIAALLQVSPVVN
jgi:hypothetical protein